jgi:hypothetical protein
MLTGLGGGSSRQSGITAALLILLLGLAATVGASRIESNVWDDDTRALLPSKKTVWNLSNRRRSIIPDATTLSALPWDGVPNRVAPAPVVATFLPFFGIEVGGMIWR